MHEHTSQPDPYRTCPPTKEPQTSMDNPRKKNALTNGTVSFYKMTLITGYATKIYHNL
jgi:hypothetical protein